MTKRDSTRGPNGRSTIYEGTDGWWHGRVTMGVKPDGTPDRRHVRGRTRAIVADKVKELERKRNAGAVAKAGRVPTVAEWMRTWLTTIAPRTASDDTVQWTYRPKVEHWIIPRLGGHRIDRLQPEHLDEFYLGLKAEGLAPKSVLMIHQILSRALKMAVRRNIVARNVATLVDSPTFRETEIEPLTAVEARRILGAVSKMRNGARWSVALALGLRQCEALGMRWSCLDLDEGTLRVFQLQRERYRHGCDDARVCAKPHHVAGCPAPCDRHKKRCPKMCAPDCTGHAQHCPERVGGGWVFRAPKGGRARTVAVPPPLVKAPRRQRTAQAKEQLSAGESWDDQWDLVFAKTTGRPLDPHEDWEEWKRICASVGVRDARVHDARHTAATLLLEQGVDIRVVQGILGHATLAVTRRYTHVTDKLARDAAARMGRALWVAEN
jgi:integrase